MTQTTKPWVKTECVDLDLGDERLNKRARTLMDRFSSQPTASIPMACDGGSETIATYRFLGNEAVDWRDIMAPHYAQTRQRMRAHAVVLCLQDTTELDFDGQDIIGLGPLSYEAQRGMYLRPMPSPRNASHWVSRTPGGGHASRKTRTASARGPRRAFAGQRATSALPRWRLTCPPPDGCMWPTGNPTSSN